MLTVVENKAQEEAPCSLGELAREGARRMLQSALAEEVAAYIERHEDELDERGHRLVVRNGNARVRKVTCGAGTLEIRSPRVNDRRTDDAEESFDAFVDEFSPKYEKAVECLARDRERLLSFFDFPAEHWKHLRTTNPIESAFATVRLRQRVTKGAGNRTKGLMMAFKLLAMAQQRWRKLNGAHLLPLVRAGVEFEDGRPVGRNDDDQKEAA